MICADERISVGNWKAHNLCLKQEAQEYFFDWRNELYSQKPELPDIAKGFLPKIVGSALRLSGALHCMDHFARNDTPKNIMVLEDIHKGDKGSHVLYGPYR